VRTAVAVIVVGAAVVAGCGGADHARRDAVNLYFDRVDKAQAQVRIEAVPIEKAFARFSTVRNTKNETRALVRAQTVLQRAYAKMQRMRPPDDAVELHTDLVDLYALQAEVAGELVAMTRFVPQYDAALRPVKQAHATLGSDLTGAKGWQKLAAAFERYRLSLVGVLAQLDRLSPPPTFRPAFDVERSTLRHSVALCSSTEAALARHDAKKTAAGIRALAGVGTEDTVARARRDQVAAAKTYNAKLVRISTLTAKIGRERDRLVGEVG
jgi:hypothetical protein